MSDLSQKIRSSGFIIENAEYIDSIGFFASYLYKLINQNGKISINSIVFYDKFIFKISRFFDIFFSK